MKIENKNFPNIGYSQLTFTDEELKPVRDEIDEIRKNNFLKGISVNKDLAGNLEKEFDLSKSHSHIQRLLLPVIIEYDKYFNYMQSIAVLKNDGQIILDKLWVNFQSKTEFNPSHIHSGVFSFVIWLDIPYDINEEKNRISSKNSKYNCPGHFEFGFTNAVGRLSTITIPADRSYKNCGLLFPSITPHSVYPFYTSNDYRVSVSGNFVIDSK